MLISGFVVLWLFLVPPLVICGGLSALYLAYCNPTRVEKWAILASWLAPFVCLGLGGTLFGGLSNPAMYPWPQLVAFGGPLLICLVAAILGEKSRSTSRLPSILVGLALAAAIGYFGCAFPGWSDTLLNRPTTYEESGLDIGAVVGTNNRLLLCCWFYCAGSWFYRVVRHPITWRIA